MSKIVSSNMQKIKTSLTVAVTSKANELRSQGKDVIGLGAGETDFDTPDHIKNKAIEAINTGKTKYTDVSGIKELKKAIVNKFEQDNNIIYNTDQIIVANGAKQVIFNAFFASLNPNDEVIIPIPYWVSYTDIVTLSGGKTILVQTNQDQDFKLTPELLEKNISDKTKWIIINSPTNPTGNTYSKDELLALLNVVEKYPQVNVLADDIYEYIIYDDFQFFTCAELKPNLKDRILTVNGVSKSFSMTGWRIGYAAGNTELIKSMSALQSHSTSSACSISQYAALEALTANRDFMKTRLIEFQERRNLVVSEINKGKNISCKVPQGAFYAFVSIQNTIGKSTKLGQKINNSLDFAKSLIEEELVAVVPGEAFGMNNHLRLSYVLDKVSLQKALDRINQFCDNLK